MAGKLRRRALYIWDILKWAERHRAEAGTWPTSYSGHIIGVTAETWSMVDKALRQGLRGLNAGSSLARLLAERRGVRNCQALQPLTEVKILEWVDAYHKQTGTWPIADSGTIPNSG